MDAEKRLRYLVLYGVKQGPWFQKYVVLKQRLFRRLVSLNKMCSPFSF